MFPLAEVDVSKPSHLACSFLRSQQFISKISTLEEKSHSLEVTFQLPVDSIQIPLCRRLNVWVMEKLLKDARIDLTGPWETSNQLLSVTSRKPFSTENLKL